MKPLLKKSTFDIDVYHLILQQTVTLSKYCYDALNICHP